MQPEVGDGRIETKRQIGDKTAILQRLARIEGQIRGLRLMAEQGRETAEQIQQVNAVVAALREVALLSVSQEIKGRLTTMAADPVEGSAGVQGIVELLRATFRLT